MAKRERRASVSNGGEKLPHGLPSPDGKETRAEDELKTAIDDVIKEFDADIYLYSGDIADEGFGKLAYELSTSSTARQTAVLILVTNGGLANSAYQIARLMQNSYRNFILYVPSYCRSAGTLVALGANKLIMDPFSELGPLDVQLLQPNELAARKSGLLSRSAFEGLRDEAFNLFQAVMLDIIRRSRGHIGFKIASQLSAEMTSALMAPVYAQMNPDIIGSDKRDLDVATDYGARLVYHSGNATVATVIHLVNHYPSHDFIIDFDEASGLFESVEMPSPCLYELVGNLGDLVYDEADPVVVQAIHALFDQASAKDESDHQQSQAASPEAGAPDSNKSLDGDRRQNRPGNPEAKQPSRGQSAGN